MLTYIKLSNQWIILAWVLTFEVQLYKTEPQKLLLYVQSTCFVRRESELTNAGTISSADRNLVVELLLYTMCLLNSNEWAYLFSSELWQTSVPTWPRPPSHSHEKSLSKNANKFLPGLTGKGCQARWRLGLFIFSNFVFRLRVLRLLRLRSVYSDSYEARHAWCSTASTVECFCQIKNFHSLLNSILTPKTSVLKLSKLIV